MCNVEGCTRIGMQPSLVPNPGTCCFCTIRQKRGGRRAQIYGSKTLHISTITSSPPGKPQFQQDLLSDQPSLQVFVGPKSWFLFLQLNADGLWLQSDPENWDNCEEYKRMESILSDLKVVNDLAERCIKDVQDFKDVTTDSTYRDEVLLVATDHQGVFQDL